MTIHCTVVVVAVVVYYYGHISLGMYSVVRIVLLVVNSTSSVVFVCCRLYSVNDSVLFNLFCNDGVIFVCSWKRVKQF